MSIFKSFTLVILIGIATVGLTVTSARGAAITHLDSPFQSSDTFVLINVNARRAMFPYNVSFTTGCPCGINPIDVRFDAGLYSATLVGQSTNDARAQGAQFEDYFPGLGGDRTRYSAGIGIDPTIGTKGQADSFFYFGGGEDFDFFDHTAAQKVEFFTILTSGTVLSFGVNALGSNLSGGVSIVLERTGDLNVIPLPAALPLFLTGLAGLSLIRRRQRQA